MREDRVADLGWCAATRGRRRELVVAEGVEQGVAEHAEQQHGATSAADPALVVVEVGLAAPIGARVSMMPKRNSTTMAPM